MYSKRIAGLLSFVGASQFFIFMLISEALYPGYSISENMISDLGIGFTAAFFNSSIIVLGLMIIFSAIAFHSFHKKYYFTFLLSLTGVGAVGVGLFPENFSPYHEISAGITFLFGGITQIFSFALIRFPFSIVVIILGGLTLASLVLFVLEIYLGMGPGGMERMIVYPVILWGAGFGGYLMASERR
ncbi:MAG: DUF998 domain-containing protein [Methanotrichaceae archaeon]|nr:DUF998 domain-containing protein [Methanotrichaceae archaeon]